MQFGFAILALWAACMTLIFGLGFLGNSVVLLARAITGG